jgi:histidyl-tRNA synthetase
MKHELPKGMHDFSTSEMMQKNHIIKIIKNQTELFAFNEIETSSIEKLSTLNCKYGDEADKLIFKILNSGIIFKEQIINYLNKKIIHNNTITSNIINNNYIANNITKKGLRYDLTVSLIRHIKTNLNNIILPYKTFQIGKVWRADNPQKGRYREFYQCDIDIINNYKNSSLWEEVELLILCYQIFKMLNIPITININHRQLIKILCNIADIDSKYINNFIKVIDKSYNKTYKEIKYALLYYNIKESSIKKIIPILGVAGDINEKLKKLDILFKKYKIKDPVLYELKFIYNNFTKITQNHKILNLNLNLMRGLSYYNGIIFEGIAAQSKYQHSICGGGRYNTLTKLFNMKNISAVGFSIGLNRLLLTLQELDIYTHYITSYPKVLFLNYNDDSYISFYELIQYLREKNITAEIFIKNIKIKNQMEYANKKNINFIIKKNQQNVLYIRNMTTGLENIINKKEDLINIIIT